jgi:hypothetical protein
VVIKTNRRHTHAHKSEHTTRETQEDTPLWLSQTTMSTAQMVVHSSACNAKKKSYKGNKREKRQSLSVKMDWKGKYIKKVAGGCSVSTMSTPSSQQQQKKRETTKQKHRKRKETLQKQKRRGRRVNTRQRTQQKQSQREKTCVRSLPGIPHHHPNSLLCNAA